MPELPEVETIVWALRPQIQGKRIKEVWTDTPRLFRGSAGFNEVKKYIKGKTIQGCERQGKRIFIAVGGDKDLVIHLMMTGKLLLGASPSDDKHLRFFIKFSDGIVLSFSDIRKFGKIDLEDRKKGLNTDALTISYRKFSEILRETNQKIKPFLLNQKYIAGIGNIYADEILWEAGIHPLRSTGTLSEEERKRLHGAMRRVLRNAIRRGGTTFRDYRTLEGKHGGYFPFRKVYKREGEPCARDGALIDRIRVASRSTHFCPLHQI
jgi:formamidopyrimidine-DNA glycosylase